METLLVVIGGGVMLLPPVLQAQEESSLDFRMPDGSAHEFPSTASFHRSEDGGTIGICVTPPDHEPGLTLVASFDIGDLPVEVEGDAVITLLGMIDPLLGLYRHDRKPNQLRLSSFSDGVLLGSYVGTVRGIGGGSTIDDVWVRSSFRAAEVTDDSCPQPENR